jgi:segregation and condensation protein A
MFIIPTLLPSDGYESKMKKVEQQASLNIKLNDFDGPLDVLETLIRDHKMDILNLDVSLLTEQYVKFINKYINVISIEQASEYLIMASYLLELKSKKVLPIENTGLPNSNFEYERDKLVHRILEYKKIKDVIPKLLNKQINRMEMYGKPADDLEAYATEQVKVEELPESVSPDKLLKAIQNAFEK